MGQLNLTRRPKVPELRKGDTVMVLTGKDAGKQGVVERVMRDRQGPAKTKARGGGAWANAASDPRFKIVVEGVNIAKRHTKPRQSSSSTDRMPKVQQGGILEIAQPLSVGKVMIVCPECKEPTRVGHETLASGERVRTCKRGHRLEEKG